MRYSPHEYQRYAAEYIKAHPAAAVFLACGLGKTSITLTAVNDLMFDSFEIHRALVVAPIRVASFSWPAEIEKWDHLKGLRYSVAVGTAAERLSALKRQADIYLINRENVQWLIAESGMGREAKICVICGKSFIPRKSSQQCCSSKCGNIKGHESMKHYYNCQYCGKPFWRENAFRMKYCGEDCRKAALKELHPPKPPKEKRVYSRKCTCCGNTFETEYANQVYCSKECSYEGNLRLKRKQWAASYKPKTIICKECNTPFTTECGDTHSVFCCQSCADKSERRREHMTERHKAYMAGCKEIQVVLTPKGHSALQSTLHFQQVSYSL